MATFIWLASYGSKKRIQPRVLQARFGDGYSQRVADGINTQLRSWTVSFNDRSKTEADAIEAFLIARNGVESFDWTDPDGRASKWLCSQWERDPTKGPYSTISCAFEEVPGE